MSLERRRSSSSSGTRKTCLAQIRASAKISKLPAPVMHVQYKTIASTVLAAAASIERRA